MTTDQLDAHHERQFLLLSAMLPALIIRLLLSAFGLVAWNGLIWLAIVIAPIAWYAWLLSLGTDASDNR